ncbi:hypothetical protein MRX96_013456 [Rhipicephalus microplus]
MNATFFSSSIGAARKAYLLTEVAATLNALELAVKEVGLWLWYWVQLCNDCRKRARQLESQIKDTCKSFSSSEKVASARKKVKLM